VDPGIAPIREVLAYLAALTGPSQQATRQA
jgi:hypothetical protein